MSVNYERVIPFELLINDGNIEKGYGALYGQELVPGEEMEKDVLEFCTSSQSLPLGMIRRKSLP